VGTGSSSTAAHRLSCAMATRSFAASDALDTPRTAAHCSSCITVSGGSCRLKRLRVWSLEESTPRPSRSTLLKGTCRRLILDCEHRTRSVPRVQPISFAISAELTPCSTIFTTRSRAVGVTMAALGMIVPPSSANTCNTVTHNCCTVLALNIECPPSRTIVTSQRSKAYLSDRMLAMKRLIRSDSRSALQQHPPRWCFTTLAG
jgi:hypothetical protein